MWKSGSLSFKSQHKPWFDGAGSWSFGRNFFTNVVIFGVVNSSSSRIDNQKNSFLVLGDGPTDNINDSVDSREKI